MLISCEFQEYFYNNKLKWTLNPRMVNSFRCWRSELSTRPTMVRQSTSSGHRNGWANGKLQKRFEWRYTNLFWVASINRALGIGKFALPSISRKSETLNISTSLDPTTIVSSYNGRLVVIGKSTFNLKSSYML
jgi:hypothetical protein